MSSVLKIEPTLNKRLLRIAKAHDLSKTDVLRLAMDAGLPKVEEGLRLMKGGTGREGRSALAMAVDAEQRDEMRKLYKSAVTDLVPDVEHLEGKEFVAAVEPKLELSRYSHADIQRMRRFLAVYAQLF